MKARGIIGIGCLILGLSCQNRDNEVNSAPAIESVYFPGIPDKDVQLDEAKRTITVQLPAVLKDKLRPIFRLTNGAKILNSSGLTPENEVDLNPLCHCVTPSPYYEQQNKKIVIGNGAQQKSYLLTILPSKGSLKALPSDEKFRFSRSSKRLHLNFAVENLYKNHCFIQIQKLILPVNISVRLPANGPLALPGRSSSF